MDQGTFFREATLRICSSLDVETFLWKSFLYIRRYVPAERVYLTHFYSEKGEQLALAMASEEGGSLLNVSVPVPAEAGKLLGRPGTEVQIIEKAEDHPPTRAWISRGLIPGDVALLAVRLTVGSEIIGAVIFENRASGTFTREHADLLTLVREPFAIALSNGLRYQELLELKNLLVEDNRFLSSELRQVSGDEVIGAEFGLKRVMEMVRQVAPLMSPVLLLGETGTGKEVVANAIHGLSSRRNGPLIKVNCGAIPENLMDSELFGHEKGAFTGALSRKRGRFERARNGTIFLDEVGELNPDAQVRLLRVLQEKEIERVGGTEPIPVDIRILAATHRDLEDMVREGSFREDLFFRLKVFPIVLPPLRERKEDIPLLVQHFMLKKAREMGLRRTPVLGSGALDRLVAYPWPGNVREMENAVERALILSKGHALSFDDLEGPAASRGAVHRDPETAGVQPGEPLALDALLTRHIQRVLALTGGKVGGRQGAAELLEINPSTLRKKMRKLGIPFGRNASPWKQKTPQD